MLLSKYIIYDIFSKHIACYCSELYYVVLLYGRSINAQKWVILARNMIIFVVTDRDKNLQSRKI